MRLLKYFLLMPVFAMVSICGAFACESGEYLNDGVCEACVAGYYCDGENDPVQCSGNNYSESGADECVSCGDNTYANSNHTQCVACDALNEYIDNGVCVTCQNGYFSNVNRTDCIACDAGNYMDNGVCKICESGYFCDGNGTRQMCVGASVSGNGATECAPCNNSEYADVEHLQCVSCVGTNKYTDNGVCKTCGAGYYINLVTGICAKCPPGYYCDGEGEAQECQTGSYAPNEGMTECRKCPTGYTTYSTEGELNTSSSVCEPVRTVKLSFWGNNVIELPKCLTVVKNN